MQENSRTGKIGVVLCTLVLATGCVIFSDANKDQQTALDDGRSRWEGTGITDYTIRYQRVSSCVFCDPADLVAVRLTVRADTLREVFDLDQGQAVVDFLPGIFLTINELFDFVQIAIDQRAAEIDVSYDMTLGYPIDIDVDISRRFFDDDLGFRVREFAQLN